MASERESRYRNPYDDGASPVAMGLAGLVLVVILLVAGWIMLPCHWVPGIKPCGEPPPPRDEVRRAIDNSCRAPDAQQDRAGESYDLSCGCVASRLVPYTVTAGQPGLTDEGIWSLYRALVDTTSPATFYRLDDVLGYQDTVLYQNAITRREDDGGCVRVIPVSDIDQYPAQPWPVSEGCSERLLDEYASGLDGEPVPHTRGSYVTVHVDWERRRRAICLPRESASRLFADGARYWLLRGDAELSRHDVQCLAETSLRDSRELMACAGGWRGGITWIDNLPRQTALDGAMRYWHQASDWGRPFGAQASIMAQRRLQAHMVQCLSSADGTSLRRLVHGGPDGRSEAVLLSLRQRALAALGYYGGPIDGQYTAETRDATRGFQRELGYDETGTLTPRQTTLLICHAAQTARDAEVQNALGIMYAIGLGVAENIDLSLEWLETAARRNDRDAYLNLALIYGTGQVLGSYRLCGVTENAEQADAYLREAARLRHPRAMQWCNTLGCGPGQLSSSERWRRIQELLAAEGWPSNNFLDPELGPLQDSCLHAETRHGAGPP